MPLPNHLKTETSFLAGKLYTEMGNGSQFAGSVLEAPAAGEGGSCRLEQVVFLIISALKTSSETGLTLFSLLLRIEP